MVSTMEAVEILKEAKAVERGINQENIGFFKGKIKNPVHRFTDQSKIPRPGI